MLAVKMLEANRQQLTNRDYQDWAKVAESEKLSVNTDINQANPANPMNHSSDNFFIFDLCSSNGLARNI